MQYEWNKNKQLKNIRKHGIDFTSITDFHWETAIEAVDNRSDYDEERINTIGFLNEKIVILTYTKRQNAIRIISLRKATRTEERFYYDYC